MENVPLFFATLIAILFAKMIKPKVVYVTRYVI